MVYLIVGVDRHSLAPWHGNVRANHVDAAERLAVARADGQGVELVVAAAIGPNASIVPSGPRPSSSLGPRRWGQPHRLALAGC